MLATAQSNVVSRGHVDRPWIFSAFNAMLKTEIGQEDEITEDLARGQTNNISLLKRVTHGEQASTTFFVIITMKYYFFLRMR